MPTRAYKLVRGGILASALLILVMGLMAVRVTREFLNANKWVSHTTDVIAEVRAARMLLGVAAGAQHDGSEEARLAALRQQMDNLSQLTSDNKWQQKNIADFRNQIARVSPEGSGVGPVFVPGALESANAILDRMQREEYGLFLDRSRAATQAMESAGIAIACLCAGLCALGLATTYTARREYLRRLRAESTLEMEKQALTRHGKELSLISHGSELIQAVEDEGQLTQAVTKVLSELVPGSRGYFALVASAAKAVEICGPWGYVDTPQPFSPTACLALQLGKRIHRSENQVHASCTHVADGVGDSLCMPVRSANGHLGLLHIESESKLSAQTADSVALLAAHVALGLTNLRVREGLRNQSVRDSLTGLFNRRYFDETLQRELISAQRAGCTLSVLLIDLDHFKMCNDNFGHSAGDDALRGFARLLQASFRESDVVCRYGGEEFSVILVGASLPDAYAKAEAFRRLVEISNLTETGPDIGRLTTSIGIASSKEFATAAKLVSGADAALYHAKRSGRNCTRVCSDQPGNLPAVQSSSVSLGHESLTNPHSADTPGHSSHSIS